MDFRLRSKWCWEDPGVLAKLNINMFLIIPFCSHSHACRCGPASEQVCDNSSSYPRVCVGVGCCFLCGTYAGQLCFPSLSCFTFSIVRAANPLTLIAQTAVHTNSLATFNRAIRPRGCSVCRAAGRCASEGLVLAVLTRSLVVRRSLQFIKLWARWQFNLFNRFCHHNVMMWCSLQKQDHQLHVADVQSDITR